MDIDRAFEESEALAERLLSLVELPSLNDSPRIEVAGIACSLALEHWHSVRILLKNNGRTMGVRTMGVRLQLITKLEQWGSDSN